MKIKISLSISQGNYFYQSGVSNSYKNLEIEVEDENIMTLYDKMLNALKSFEKKTEVIE